MDVNHLLCVWMLLTIDIGETSCTLTQRPTHTAAMVDHYPASFNCSTSKRPVKKHAVWRYYPRDAEGDKRKYIYDGGKVNAEFQDRMYVDIDELSGAFNLVIRLPQLTDDGRYECSDDHAHKGSSAELVVLDAFGDTTNRQFYTGDNVSCVANATRELTCSYHWYNDKMTYISSNLTFTPIDPGLYKCEAQCTIRNVSWKFVTTVINVSESDEGIDPKAPRSWLIESGAIYGLIVGLIFVVAVCIWKRRAIQSVFRNVMQLFRNFFSKSNSGGASKKNGMSDEKIPNEAIPLNISISKNQSAEVNGGRKEKQDEARNCDEVEI